MEGALNPAPTGQALGDSSPRSPQHRHLRGLIHGLTERAAAVNKRRRRDRRAPLSAEPQWHQGLERRRGPRRASEHPAFTRRLHLLAAALGLLAGLIIPAALPPSAARDAARELNATEQHAPWPAHFAAAAEFRPAMLALQSRAVAQDSALQRAQQLHDQARMLTRAELDLDERQAAEWLLAAGEIEERLASGSADQEEVHELIAARTELVRVGLVARSENGGTGL